MSAALVTAAAAALLGLCAASQPSSHSSFGAPYNPKDQSTGLCKESWVLREEVESVGLVRLDSMASDCVLEVLAAIIGGTSQVWLGLRETSDDDNLEFAALQRVLRREDLMASVAGVHVSNEDLLDHEKHPTWHKFAQYVERVRSFVHESQPTMPVVVSDAVTHSSRRVIHGTGTANSTNGTAAEEGTIPTPDVPTLEPTPEPTAEPTPTEGDNTLDESGGDNEDDASTTEVTTTPAPTSYFGAGCPETEIQHGDSSRAILARVCPGYSGPCHSSGAPTMWTTAEHTQCPKLLRIGDFVRVCCTLA
ncbi:hypothetical protein H310_10225 [Aphanomyces invadans]|uniref:glucan endo-1,3-beta-D-glucosidase n=1 Tax=Aphanomyces invadans TaxID=157072 RepID=A0A024TT66_9STRA|nr:hypothetical protein H310_10225 [Aphanomyces invadans]ETV96497.1 hypothetical protein H310_10225 [Aphanomyces invadans]|eukprot:XP_008874760.1 hypothetical protein H310_10225 [Aphanomyces invadans]